MNYHYEFGGPVGTMLMFAGLPTFLYSLYFLCEGPQCLELNASSLSSSVYSAWAKLSWSLFFSWSALAVTFVWFLWFVLLWNWLPGRLVLGAKLPNGSKLPYRLNGFASLISTLLALAFLQGSGWFDIAVIYDHFPQYITSTLILALLVAVYVYLKAVATKGEIQDVDIVAHKSPSSFYNFFIGQLLNPRDGEFDWKEFCELRPGLIGWLVVNLAMATKAYHLHGQVSTALLATLFMEGFYVCDALYHEQAILTTMDIVYDGFGFMLSFGDLCWVPCFYSIGARYLVTHPRSLSLHELLLILAVNAIGFIIFRTTNSQKDRFRTDPTHPSVRDYPFIETKVCLVWQCLPSLADL